MLASVIARVPVPQGHHSVYGHVFEEGWEQEPCRAVVSPAAPSADPALMPAAAAPRRHVSAADVRSLLSGGSDAVVGRLQREGVHVDAADENGWTLLMHSSAQRLSGHVVRLLAGGADARIVSTRLCWAAGGHPRLVGAHGALGRFGASDELATFPRGVTAADVVRSPTHADAADWAMERRRRDIAVALCVHLRVGEQQPQKAGALGAALTAESFCSTRVLGGLPNANSHAAAAPAAVEGEGAVGESGTAEWRPLSPRALVSTVPWLASAQLPAHYRTAEELGRAAETEARLRYHAAVQRARELRRQRSYGAAAEELERAVAAWTSTDGDADGSAWGSREAAAPQLRAMDEVWDISNQRQIVQWRHEGQQRAS
jgi:hypothetical protein